MDCKYCAFENADNAEFCVNCGASLVEEAANYDNNQYYGDNGEYYGDNNGYNDDYQPAPHYSDGMGIASMVLGIVSLLICNGWGIIPLVALILGIIANKKAKAAGTKSGFAIAGIVTGAIGIVTMLFAIVAMIIYLFVFGGLALFTGGTMMVGY